VPDRLAECPHPEAIQIPAEDSSCEDCPLRRVCPLKYPDRTRLRLDKGLLTTDVSLRMSLPESAEMHELLTGRRTIGRFRELTVRPLSCGQFGVIEDERHYSAFLSSDENAIDVFVRHVRDHEAVLIAFTERFHEKELSSEEQIVVLVYLRQFYKSTAELARAVGKMGSESLIRQRLQQAHLIAHIDPERSLLHRRYGELDLAGADDPASPIKLPQRDDGFRLSFSALRPVIGLPIEEQRLVIEMATARGAGEVEVRQMVRDIRAAAGELAVPATPIDRAQQTRLQQQHLYLHQPAEWPKVVTKAVAGTPEGPVTINRQTTYRLLFTLLKLNSRRVRQFLAILGMSFEEQHQFSDLFSVAVQRASGLPNDELITILEKEACLALEELMPEALVS